MTTIPRLDSGQTSALSRTPGDDGDQGHDSPASSEAPSNDTRAAHVHGFQRHFGSARRMTSMVVRDVSLSSTHRGRDPFQRASTMLVSPIGLLTPLAAFVKMIDTVSTAVVALGFVTVLKFPNGFGKVSLTVNTGAAFRSPVIL